MHRPESLRQGTVRADDAAFWRKTRDTLIGKLEESAFPCYLDEVRDSARRPIEADPFERVEVTARRYRLSEP